MKKTSMIFGIMLIMLNMALAQDCTFKVKFEVIPATCYNNGKVAYALTDGSGRRIRPRVAVRGIRTEPPPPRTADRVSAPPAAPRRDTRSVRPRDRPRRRIRPPARRRRGNRS